MPLSKAIVSQLCLASIFCVSYSYLYAFCTSRQNETITCIHRDKIVRPFSFVPFTNLHVLYIYTHNRNTRRNNLRFLHGPPHIYIYIFIYMHKTNYCFNHSHGYHGCMQEQRWLGAVHKQVCVTINVKLTFGGVGM